MARGRKRQSTRDGVAEAAGAEPDKRRTILHAAVRVFAEKGYHGCRIADIAREAEVAYGLVYHYFKNKDDLLESVFDEQWAIFIQSLRAIQAGPGSPSEQLALVCSFGVDVFKRAPSAVRVLLLEVARTPHVLKGGTHQTFETAVGLIAEIVRKGQELGELRPEADPMVTAASFLGALELCLTSMLVGLLAQPIPSEEEIERVKRNLIDFVLGGVALKAHRGLGGQPEMPKLSSLP